MKFRFKKNAALIALSFSIVGAFSAPCANAKEALPIVITRGFSDELSANLIGKYAIQIGDLKLTAMSYEQAWRKKPSNQENFEAAVRAHLVTGNYEKALKISQSANSKTTSNESNLVLANDAFGKKNFAKAIKFLENRTDGAADGPYAQQLLAWSILGSGDYEKALEKSAEVSGNRNLEKAIYYSRALIYDFAGDKQKAADAYEIAYASGSRVSLGLVSYAEFLVKNNDRSKALEILEDVGQSHAANEFLFETQTQIKAGKFPPMAKPNLTKTAARALGIIGLAMSEDLRNGSPLGSLAMASNLDRELWQLKLNSGAMLVGLGMKEEGLETLGSIPTDTVFGDQAQALMANLMFRDDPKQALQIAKDLVKARPSFSNKVTLASMLLGTENFQEAHNLYSELLKEFPNKSAQEANVNQWQLLFGRANSALAINKSKEAIKDLRTALLLEPNNSMILNTLGYTLAEQNQDLDEAMELIEKSLEINSNSGETIDSLGWVMFKKGQYEEAIDQLEVAFALAPTIGEVADHLGDAYWVTNRKDEARLEWGKALSLYKSAKDKAKVKAKIDNGLKSPAKSASNTQ